jgi:hypothetical protein
MMPMVDNIAMRERFPNIGLVERVMIYVFGLLIFVLGFQYPNLHPSGMDQSWNAVLAYGFEKRWSFGKDLIFTYGPWGWLENPEITLGTLWLKILWEFLFNGLLVAALITTAFSFSKPSRWCFLLSSLIFTRTFPDTAVYLLAVIILSEWCLNQRLGSLTSYLSMIPLSFLAEMKITLGIIIVTGVGVIISTFIFNKNPRVAAIYLGIFFVSSAFFWKLAGQNWCNIPEFLLSSKEISGGYQNAMALSPATVILILGLIVVGVNALTLIVTLWKRRTQPIRLGSILIILMVYILVWKHSFIRADGHVLALFSIAPLLSIYSVEFLKLPIYWRSSYISTIIISLVVVFMVNSSIIPNLIDIISQKIHQQIPDLLHSVREKREERFNYNENMSDLRKTLRDSTVDVISYEQGDAISAGLNYRCRPVPQSYSAYTPWLLEKNANFYKSPSAPDAVLFKLQTIDARVPMMDDSLVLMELLDHYRYCRDVGGFALFTKINHREFMGAEKPMVWDLHKQVHLWENIPLPTSLGPIWIKINSRLSWIGRIRSVFFQTPNLCIAVRDFQGKEDHFRVVPAMGKTGFLLSPWITTTEEFVTYSKTGTGRTAQSIRIQPLGLGEDRFWKSLEVMLYDCKNFPSPRKINKSLSLNL